MKIQEEKVCVEPCVEVDSITGSQNNCAIRLLENQAILLNELIKPISRLTSELSVDTQISINLDGPLTGVLLKDRDVFLKKLESNNDVLGQLIKILNNSI
jgi:hypothetical protein